MTTVLTAFILLDMAHVLSPLALSWLHGGLRRVMLDDPGKYIVPSVVLFSAGAAVSLAMGFGALKYVPASKALGDFSIPSSMLKLYLLWNVWHYSAQNMGVLQLIYRNKFINLPVALIGTTAAFWISPIALSVVHWLTDIGLSGYVLRRRGLVLLVFLALIFAGSPVALLWETTHNGEIWDRALTPFVTMLLGLRMSVSGAHFLTSGLIWRLSNPQIRTAIGRELFACM